MTTTASKPKAIPPQADVRILGGKTTVKLRAYGKTTLDRFHALFDELAENASTHAEIAKAVDGMVVPLSLLSAALHYPTADSEAGDEEAE